MIDPYLSWTKRKRSNEKNEKRVALDKVKKESEVGSKKTDNWSESREETMLKPLGGLRIGAHRAA